MDEGRERKEKNVLPESSSCSKPLDESTDQGSPTLLCQPDRCEQCSYTSIAVLAVGTSTMDISALQQFFTGIPADSSICFITLLHPAECVDLPKIVNSATTIPVELGKDGTLLRGNTVIIIPSNMSMVISNGRLCEQPLRSVSTQRPVDSLLFSLATEATDRAIAVILSGPERDGIEGISAVKRAGGLVLVQEPKTAAQPTMPRAAIATGTVDLILPAESIGNRILDVTCRSTDLVLLTGQTVELDEQLRELFRIVRNRTGHDFSSYKQTTVLRRIERRMAVKALKHLSDYLELLRENQEEAHALGQEFLIGVTSFFRDPEAFDILKTVVIPSIFTNRDREDTVRIWHPCCATGEEVYSMAMLIREYLVAHQLDCKVLIFATDISESAITIARTGSYSDAIETTVSDERRKAFFTKTGTQYQVTKPLREMIVFAQQNLIRDPPFSRLDLLVCRNFLIYLNTDMQLRLLALFHQILKPGGYLFCGSSETVDRHANQFVAINKKWKIFARSNDGKQRPALMAPAYPPQMPTIDRPVRYVPVEKNNTAGCVEKILLERYSPPCVVVNDKFEVVHVSTRTSLFLELPVGEPTRDILKMAHSDLRPALRAAIHKALTEQRQIAYRGISITEGESVTRINVVAEPLDKMSLPDKLIMVAFESSTPAEPAPSSPSTIIDSLPGDESAKDALIRQLEEQLRVTQEQLLTTIEQLESSNEGLVSVNEQLMSTNEEFQATNEELQSTNEELETSREELQSLNEELVTVNTELHGKVEELNRANSDMENFLISSDIATIFLDRNFNIMRFTPAICTIFNIIPSDVGRPFRHLASTIDWQNFSDLAQSVLLEAVPLERELANLENGLCHIMRILPYRTTTGNIDGIVVTFIDISERKLAEDNLRLAKELLRRLTDHLPCYVASIDSNERYRFVNETYRSWFGRDPDDILGLTVEELVGAENYANIEPHINSVLAGNTVNFDYSMLLPDNNRRYVNATYVPDRDQDGSIRGFYATVIDLTERQRAKEILRESEERFRGMFENHKAVMLLTDPESGGIIDANNAAADYYGYSLDELRTFNISDINKMPPDELAAMRQRIVAGKCNCFTAPHLLANGETRMVEVYSSPIITEGKVLLFSINHDVTERSLAEEALRQSEERWQFAIEGSNDGVWDRNIQTGEIFFSKKWKEMLGYAEDEIGNNAAEWLKRVHAEDLPQVRREIGRHLANEVPLYSAEYRMQCKDGSYKWILARGKVISRAEDGKPLRFVGTHSDITERKNLEEQLYQSQKMEAVGQLAGGIAHDFNNILTAIIGYSHLISMNTDQAPSGSPLRSYVEQIHSSAERAAELTQALLAFSRKQVMVPKVLSLNETVSQLEKMLRRLISENIELKLDIYSGDLNVMADKSKIEQMLINLVTNAKDAMPGNGVLSITTSLTAMNEKAIAQKGFGKVGTYACITVSDTGCGIEEETRKKIFEPFFTTKEIGKGTGLGLSIVYGIVKQHNGYIDVSSRPHKGTTFSIYLPAVKDKTSKAVAEATMTTSGGHETILLAEDDPAVRNFHKTLFEKAGYSVISAVDGKDALEAFTRHEAEIDLLVLDVVMPKINGIKLHDMICERRPDIKALFLSGYTADILKEVGGTREKEHILNKPVVPGELLKKIRQVLSGEET